jgi:hypothetical protein
MVRKSMSIGKYKYIETDVHEVACLSAIVSVYINARKLSKSVTLYKTNRWPPKLRKALSRFRRELDILMLGIPMAS